MSNSQTIIDRSRRHHQAETERRTVHLPGQTIGHPGSGGDATIWAEVIVELLNADAEREVNPTGISEYVMRLTSDATAAYSGSANYIIGSIVKGSDNRKYTSRTGTVESPNIGHNPVVDPAATTTHWTLEPEINPLPMGVSGTTAPDMREYIPRYKVGKTVALIKGVSGTTEVYYIAGMSFIDGDGSIACEDTGRVMAVYKG